VSRVNDFFIVCLQAHLLLQLLQLGMIDLSPFQNFSPTTLLIR
jgi:hypothetical protein